MSKRATKQLHERILKANTASPEDLVPHMVELFFITNNFSGEASKVQEEQAFSTNGLKISFWHPRNAKFFEQIQAALVQGYKVGLVSFGESIATAGANTLLEAHYGYQLPVVEVNDHERLDERKIWKKIMPLVHQLSARWNTTE